MRRLVYQPYGQAVAPTPGGSAKVPNFGFTGQRFEKKLGLYDYGARRYDPELGRFLQPDPIVPEPFDPQSLNRYSYVLNSPVNYVDPTGNFTESSRHDNDSDGDDEDTDRDDGDSGGGGSDSSGFDAARLENEIAQERAGEQPRTVSCRSVACDTPRSPDSAPVLAIAASFTLSVVSVPAALTAGAITIIWTEANYPGLISQAFDKVVRGIQTWQQSGNDAGQDANNALGAQAPGRPTEADGFKPKKKWDGKKVRAPNGGYGYPDRKGNVWIPTGPKGSRAHGRPHWDVQHPDGSHTNILPGRKVK